MIKTFTATVTEIERWADGDVWITYTGGPAGWNGTILMRPGLQGAKVGSKIVVTSKSLEGTTWKECVDARLK